MPEFILKIRELKNKLVIVRMPNVKMEKKGREVSINSNRSPDGLDTKNRDLLLGDPDNPISTRLLLTMYDQVMGSLTAIDILKAHHESYD